MHGATQVTQGLADVATWHASVASDDRIQQQPMAFARMLALQAHKKSFCQKPRGCMVS